MKAFLMIFFFVFLRFKANLKMWLKADDVQVLTLYEVVLKANLQD